MKPQMVVAVSGLLLLASACSQMEAPASPPTSNLSTPVAMRVSTVTPGPDLQKTMMPEPGLWLTPTSDADRQKISIAQQLFTNYLNGYKSPNTPEESRLLDFRIEDLRLYRPISTPDDPAKIYASAVFSVLLAVHIPDRDPWLVGNGRLGDNGWIIGKAQFLTIARVKDGYSIEATATAP